MTDNERKEYISALRQLVAMCDFVDQYGDSIDADPYFNAVETAIESLNETTWIPVGERLPDIDQSVLICTKDGQITDGYRWNSEDWFLAWGEFNGEHTGGEYDQIIAWMPLPKPYKGGDDNGKD